MAAAGQPGWGKHELDVGTDSGSSTRPAMQIATSEPNHEFWHSPSPGTEIRHTAPWEAPDELGPLNTPPPATSASPATPAQAQSQSARLFHEMGRGNTNTSRVHKRPGSI